MTDDPVEGMERFTRHWVGAQSVVAGYLATLVPDFRDAQDLLQTVAVVALRKYSEFDQQRPFVRWVLGMARLELLKHQRNHARCPLIRAESLDGEIAGACEELSEEFERRKQFLADCLNQLDARAATLVRLRYEEAMKPAAVADRVGMGASAVRVALSRIRARLRDCIDRKLREQPV
jgi:RNA polymerase sigma-70 factor, ECF subfamily